MSRENWNWCDGVNVDGSKCLRVGMRQRGDKSFCWQHDPERNARHNEDDFTQCTCGEGITLPKNKEEKDE